VRPCCPAGTSKAEGGTAEARCSHWLCHRLRGEGLYSVHRLCERGEQSMKNVLRAGALMGHMLKVGVCGCWLRVTGLACRLCRAFAA
jgi:hypothetical protein